MTGPQPSTVSGKGSILKQALSCQIGKGDIAGLIAEIDDEMGAKMLLQRSYAAPSGHLLHLEEPVTALGYTSRDVYVQPGRIAILVDAPLPALSKALLLQEEPYRPATRPVDESRSIVAWQLSQEGLAGKTLLGCEYQDPAAAGWLDQIEAVSADGGRGG
jgi:hypothetical protein